MGLFNMNSGGLYGIKGDIMGTNSNFHIDPMQLQNADYLNQLNQSQQQYNQLNVPGNAAALQALQSGQQAGGMQATLAQQLAAQASGQGPSLAQMQLQQASDANIKNNAALIAGQKGINPGQAARQVAMSNASQGQNLANQSAQLRLNEQMQKQQALAQVLGQQRGQDIGQYQNQLGSNQQMYSTAGQLNNQQTQNQISNYYGAAGINSGISQFNAAGAQKDAEGDKKMASSLIGGMAAHGGQIHNGSVIPAYYAGGQIAPLSGNGDLIKRPLVYINPEMDPSGWGTGGKKKKKDEVEADDPIGEPGQTDLPDVTSNVAAHGGMAHNGKITGGDCECHNPPKYSIGGFIGSLFGGGDEDEDEDGSKSAAKSHNRYCAENPQSDVCRGSNGPSGAKYGLVNFAAGGGVPSGKTTVAVSPGEKIVSPEGKVSKVPGKAKYAGDDTRNDTVIADLREGSIVVPRTKSSNKENMIDFIRHMKKSSDKKDHLTAILEAHHDIRQKLDEVNDKLGKWRPNR